MLRRRFVSLVLERAGLGLSACSLSGCGTLLHSERSGRPHSNQIDWRIAALDGLGLLLFFVPGVIAFAVDFYTGAIYLPLEETYPGYGGSPAIIPPNAPPPGYPTVPTAAPPVPPPNQPDPAQLQQLGLKRIVVPREELQTPRLEQVVTEHVGRNVVLDSQVTQVHRLSSLEQFVAAIRSRMHV